MSDFFIKISIFKSQLQFKNKGIKKYFIKNEIIKIVKY